MTNGLSPAAVPQVELCPGGPLLSQFVYGTWRLMDATDPALTTPSAVLARIRKCLDLGITTFDCADIYGGVTHVCERLFGQALALDPSIRSRIQLVSKCGIVCPSTNGDRVVTETKHYDLSVEYILKRVEESLEALGVNSLDVLLIHRPSPMMDANEVAKAFGTLKSQGKVSHFGVSNFTASQVRLLQSRLSFPLVTNQIEFHPLALEPLDSGVLDQAQELRMAPMIWSPLAGGRLVNPSLAMKDDRAKRVQDTLKSLAVKYGPSVTQDQIVYSWILAHPSRPIIILGTNQIERLETAVGALNVKLSLEDWFSVWEASAGTEVP